ncbi:lipase [Vibrio sinensis]|uniref:Lipase n=1 Tax=Vibrio sinensis TaxID=2302434 RepID=A0A3A6Q9Z2_9VIBR|nr:lipase [Vibrio sinensis]RJX68714.1 lipase [Vibrio sinensis]
MEMYNYCLLCNPEVNWLQVEFRSERNESIHGLKVTITNPSTEQKHHTTASQGRAVFENIAAGEWVVSVETDTLLSTVEQYASRKDGEDSLVKEWASETLDRDQGSKAYYAISVGDLWDTPPDDEFLMDKHGPLRANYREDAKGLRTCHNRACVLEIKALRSYLPMIVDTDEFNLVNSYTFALLSQLAYATDDFSFDDGKSTDEKGSLSTVTRQLKSKKIPEYSSSLGVQWIVQEVPYSKSLSCNYYADAKVGAEGYILSNDDIAIIGVRGSEPYFGNRNKTEDVRLWEIVKTSSGMQAVVTTVLADKFGDIAYSPAVQDFAGTNFDAAQIAPPEFGGAYVHRGFYQYAMAFRSAIGDKLEQNKNKKIYICGHSLGGAGALLLSALIQDMYTPVTLCLYTYGMPRTGTRSFVERYQNILHYRHVNNHDLVPQVPMSWVNTDLSEGVTITDFFGSRVALARKMLSDNDNDNYLHHGRLSQLITYAPSKQVLLTPRQTQITMLDIAKMANDDSVALVDGLWDASIEDHSMGQYIPGLLDQLQSLSQESLYENYQGSIDFINDEIKNLKQRYHIVKKADVETLGEVYSPVLGAKRALIQKELSIVKNQLENQHQVVSELTQIMNNPERLPLSLLLAASQSLPEEIREQLQ